MKTLIVEDDLVSRALLEEFLRGYGPLHIAVNGREAIHAVRIAREAGEPYDLICLDIMMSEMDGQAALHEIRAMEKAMGIEPSEASRILMTTALHDPKNMIASYEDQCDAHLVKPINRTRLTEELRKLKLISP
jgi:two-component system, chemotaxis family, chemotaxis protein CheY